MMPLRLPSRLLRTNHAVKKHHLRPQAASQQCTTQCTTIPSHRYFAYVTSFDTPTETPISFASTPPHYHAPPTPPPSNKPPDERTIQLGATLRTLHDRLPNLLKEPLPSEILSPQITLHLFPSTHPHLPTVSGRLAYIAALWTAPVAWGRVPLVGNVALEILSERMIRNGAGGCGTGEEKLVVKWRTCGKTTHRDGTGGVYRGLGQSGKDPVEKIRRFVAGTQKRVGEGAGKGEGGEVEGKVENNDDTEQFCGIFVFDFDEKGRVVKHVIEHTEEGGDNDRMTRVVSVTDWLLSRLGPRRDHEPALALCDERSGGWNVRLMHRRKST